MAIEMIPLSGSTNYKGIKVAANSSPGTVIHTAHATKKDKLFVWAANPDLTADYDVTTENGGTTDPDDRSVMTIPRKAGHIPVIQGLVITASNVLRAFGSTANKVVFVGYVLRED